MSFWESKLGAVIGILLLAGSLLVTVTGLRVHRATHPPRSPGDDVDFESMSMRVQQVRFPAVDGIDLAGWFIEGPAGRPPVILAHDLGASKASLGSLGIYLNGRGFTVLLLDFRGHGQSGGAGSTLGLDEKRDILGALDYLDDRRGRGRSRVGIYAVGMGAHAAVLAAADRPSLQVLVLDGLYPDASLPLGRQVFAGWEPGLRRLSFLSDGLFAVMSRTRIGEHRAADVLPRLGGRDLLLLATAEDPWLAAEMQRMVESVPPRPDSDGNLVVLPEAPGGELYGDGLGRRHEQVALFFESRLGGTKVASLARQP